MGESNVFISWSGEPSRKMAHLLRSWLGDVVRGCEPWLSSEDIAKGSVWNKEINQNLATCKAGIVVLTPENITAPWVLFECGALFKAMDDRRVCTLLCGLRPPLTGPLGQFQATMCERGDMLKLVKSLDSFVSATPNPKLENWFDKFWSDFDGPSQTIMAEAKKGQVPQSAPDHGKLLEEILGTVRSIARKVNPSDDVRAKLPEVVVLWSDTALSDLAKNLPKTDKQAIELELMNKVPPDYSTGRFSFKNPAYGELFAQLHCKRTAHGQQLVVGVLDLSEFPF